MKKRFTAALLFLLTLCLSFSCFACGFHFQGSQTVYSRLNDMAGADYPALTLTVTSLSGGVTLENRFVCTTEGDATRITYSCQERATFGDSDGVSDIPEAFITTATGTAVIRGGAVELEGEPADVDFSQVTALGFRFHADYFADVSQEDGAFTAKVIDPAGFFGGDAPASTDMTVTVKYGAVFQELAITYTTDAGTVSLLYTFA